MNDAVGLSCHFFFASFVICVLFRTSIDCQVINVVYTSQERESRSIKEAVEYLRRLGRLAEISPQHGVELKNIVRREIGHTAVLQMTPQVFNGIEFGSIRWYDIAAGANVYWDEADKQAKTDDESGANKLLGQDDPIGLRYGCDRSCAVKPVSLVGKNEPFWEREQNRGGFAVPRGRVACPTIPKTRQSGSALLPRRKQAADSRDDRSY